ncbi:MAG: AtpZ/AtpI family protein [Mariniphaga sp.]
MEHNENQKNFRQIVGSKEKQKLMEKQKSKRGLLFGLGMFGLVGWSVTVPTLLGAFLGIWLDKQFPGKQSWTLTFLLIGLIVGCVSAWHWLASEDKDIHKNTEDKNE